MVGAEDPPGLTRCGQPTRVEAAGPIAFRGQGVEHAAARQVALNRDLRREAAERGLAVQVARLAGRGDQDVGTGVDRGLEGSPSQRRLPTAAQIVGRLAIDGVLVQAVLAVLVIDIAGDVVGPRPQVGVAFLDAGGQKAADHPAQPANLWRGVNGVLDDHPNAGGFVVEAQLDGRFGELGKGQGRIVAAGVAVGDIAGDRLELAPVARALDLQRCLAEAVAVCLAHLVGAARPAGRQGDVLSVLGLDVLVGETQPDLPVAEVEPPGRAAAPARGLVDVGQAQVDVVEIAAVDVVIHHRPNGRGLADRHVEHAFEPIAVRAGLGPGRRRADHAVGHAQFRLVGHDTIDA